MASKKFTFTCRVRPEVHAEMLRRASEKKMTLTDLCNQIFEKYVSDSHQKWFEKDTQFVGRLWKKIETENVETRKDLFDMSKGVMALVELFKGMSSTRAPMEDALKKVCLEIDRINFLASNQDPKEG